MNRRFNGLRVADFGSATVAKTLGIKIAQKSNLMLLAIAVLVGLCTGPLGWAQITRPTSDQAPPAAGTGRQHIGGLNESVNPATGAVSIRIGVPVPPARGMTVPFAFGYDSNAAQHFVGGLGLADNASYLGQGGWSYVVPTLSEMQWTYQVANHAVLGSDNAVDPQVFIPCNLSDPNCSIATGGLWCSAFYCPVMRIPGQTATTPTTCTFYDHFNFADMGGGVHDLGIVAGDYATGNSNECTRAAGAPAHVDFGGDGQVLGNVRPGPGGVTPTATVVDSNGTFYSFPDINNNIPHNLHDRVADNPNLETFPGWSMLPSFIEDRNGNIAVFTDQGNGSFQVTDTLGRTAISTSGFGVSGNTVSVAGLANPYTVSWTPVSIGWLSLAGGKILPPGVQQTSPMWTCAGGISGIVVGFDSAGHTIPFQGVSRIELPNGQAYQFQYDPTYGLLSKMVYPNGGYIRYVWGINRLSSETLVASTIQGSGGGPPIPCEVIFDTPAVTQRFVSYDGQTEVEEQDFTYSTTWGTVPGDDLALGLEDWSSKQTTVVTKDLVSGTSFKTVYTYVPARNESTQTLMERSAGLQPTSPVEKTIQSFDGSGKLLRTVSKFYQNALTPPEIETVTLENGQVSQVQSCIANLGDFSFTQCIDNSTHPSNVGGLPLFNPYLGGLLTDRYEYGYGPGAPGALLRHTHFDYTLFKNPLFPDVFANPFGTPTAYLGVTKDAITYDGNGNKVAETDYGYDETAVSAVTALGHDETNYGPTSAAARVNLTSVTAKCFNAPPATSCPSATSISTFDETGQILSRKDPLGNITSYSYQDSFSNTTLTTNTNAYLTKIIAPKTNGVNHIQSFSYAYSDGQLISTTDQNGQKTMFAYDDPLRRLTETDLPDGGQTKVTYNDSGSNPSVVTTKKITANTSVVSTAVADGMGHVVQTQFNSDPLGVDFTDITLDGLGQTLSVSNPHRSTPSPTDGVTRTQYDALGRVTQVIKQDGGISTVSYSGSCTTTTDEAGKRRRACSDAFGRLIEVEEPTPGVSEATPATTATATVTISGNLQSKLLQNPATGSVFINGTDSLVSGTNSYDFGTVTVSVGGGAVSVSYGHFGSSPSSGADVAAALCSAINSTSSTSASVSCGTSGSVMNLTAKVAGAAGNGIALGVSAQTSNPQSNQSAFSSSSTSGTLSGGGATLYDSGVTAITISGRGGIIFWSGSGTTPASLASSLAAAINNDPYAFVSASASGGTVSLTAKVIGEAGNLSVSCSSGYDANNFSGPSFSISCPALSGGKEDGSLSAPMITLYSYDALGNLLQVTQQGGTSDQTQWRVRTFAYDSLSRLRRANNPESGTISYSYDASGNVALKTSPQANQLSASATTSVTYCYDALNRMLAKGYALSPNPPQQCSTTPPYLPNPAVVYIYDQGTNAIGRVSSLTDQAGSGNYTYDPLGRVATEQRTLAGFPKSMGYTYNLDGSVARATYPSGAIITYTPDPAGRVGKVQDLGNNINYVVGPGGTGTLASYGPDGALTGFLSGAHGSFTGITNSFSYNNRLQPVSMAAVSPNVNGVNATAADTVSGSLYSASVFTSGTAPPAAAGSALTSFMASDGSSHTFYLGSNQHIYHLFWNSSGGWQDQDISAVANNALAISGSALTSFASSDGNYHVVYLDSNNHVNQLVSSGSSWSKQDITAAAGANAAAAGSALSGYAGSYLAHIYYQGTNAHIYQFWWNGSTWLNNDLTTNSGTNIAAASGTKLTSFVDSLGEHSFYLGQNNHLYQLFWKGSTLANQDIMAMAALDLADGPCAPDNGTCYYGGQSHMVGYGANGSYDFLTVTGNVACNVATFGDPAPGVTKACYLVNSFPVAAAGSKLTSVVDSNGEHAYYLTSNGHNHHMLFDGANWHDQDQTSFAGTSVVAASGSALTSFTISSDGSEHVAYLGANNHVYDMLYSSATDWVNKDLTSLSGASVTAVAGSALTSFGLSATNPGHVQYLGSNGHIYHLYWNGSVWQNQDLTALATYATTVFDSGLVTLSVGGFAATACFGASTNASCTGQPANNTAGQVVTALASAINVAASPATAPVDGTTLNLTWKTGGNVTAAVNALTTAHDQPSVFSNPSFTSPATNFSGGGPGTPVTVFSLNYDFHTGNGDNGNVWGITNNKDTTRNQSFTYDALNRLTSGQNAGMNCAATTVNGKTKFWGNSYGYDAWGNLVNKAVTKCGAENLSVVALANNQLSGYGYDAAGNMTHDATSGLNYTFDQENRITGAGGFTYTYDDEGNRVKKSNGNTGTLYWYMSLGIVAESDLTGALTSEYVFFNGERVARKDYPGNAISYYFSDHLKTTDIVTDAQGNIKNESDFYPWGGELQFLANDSNHYKFTGKERDSESGLDYFGARYYSNGLGRFISSDWSATPIPVPYADFTDPQTLNQYSYVRNVPSSKADPDGHCWPLCGLIGPVTQWLTSEVGVKDPPHPILNAFGSAMSGNPDFNINHYSLEDAANIERNTTALGLTIAIGEAMPSGDTGSSGVRTDVESAGEGAALRGAASGAEVPTSIPAGPSARPTTAQQGAINAMGEAHGCSTCPAKTPGTKSGNWVGDHQPSTSVNPPGNPQVYRPQCLPCSLSQGGQLRAAQAKAAAAARRAAAAAAAEARKKQQTTN